LGPLLRLCSALALLLIPMAASAAITPHQLAVIINEDDPDSFKLGQYYAQQRGIPPENIVQVPLGIPKAEISPEAFDRAYIKVRINTRERIEGYALAFTYPYRVGCMSITTAFAMGYGKRFCADGCHPTAPNPYFDEEGGQPWETFGLHPTMMLAAKSLESGKRLVDRGVASDGTKPTGHAYLVVTSDATRSTRARQFPIAKAVWGDRFSTSIEQTDGIRDKRDVMFYFTGTPQVPYLDTLRFLPGAIADHLTSSGGQLDGKKQMPALAWLEAGATASYGTVAEPCNFTQKFPDASIVMRAYLSGDTALEAYWKSVVWPGQGLFIGEPLARPFGPVIPH
jgi:uncharacterized protein (TIGR03790 family)